MNDSKQTAPQVVGVDIAKRVFQLHWIDVETGEIMSVQLKREKLFEHFANRAGCLIGMEACGGAQHWARVGQLDEQVAEIERRLRVWRHLLTHLVDSWRAQRDRQQQAAQRVGDESDATPTGQCGGGGAGQQDGTNDLGAAGARTCVPKRVREPARIGRSRQYQPTYRKDWFALPRLRRFN